MSLIKNTASQYCSARLINASDGSNVTSGVAVTVQIDGAAQAASAGTLTHKGSGVWEYQPTQAETNCDHIVINFDEASAIGVTKEFYPVVQVDVNASGEVSCDVKKINGGTVTGDGTTGNEWDGAA